MRLTRKGSKSASSRDPEVISHAEEGTSLTMPPGMESEQQAGDLINDMPVALVKTESLVVSPHYPLISHCRRVLSSELLVGKLECIHSAYPRAK